MTMPRMISGFVVAFSVAIFSTVVVADGPPDSAKLSSKLSVHVSALRPRIFRALNLGGCAGRGPTQAKMAKDGSGARESVVNTIGRDLVGVRGAPGSS